MVRVRFSGRIYPRHYKVTLDPIPPVSAFFPDFNMRIAFLVQIRDSVVTVDCDCPQFEAATHGIPVLIRATDLARAPVDVFAFREGLGVFLLIEEFTDEKGQTSPVTFQDPKLSSLATSITKLDGPQFKEFLDMVMIDPPFYRTFRDLNRILTDTHVAPQYAFRAVEGIRHMLSPGEKDKLKSWGKLGAILRIEKSFIDPMTANSTGPRHGDPTHVPGSAQIVSVERAWQVMNRYIEYRMRGGNDPLPLSEFPLLV